MGDEHARDIWVNGIAKLLGMSEEDRQAAEDAYNPAEAMDNKPRPQDKTPSQLQTQRSLFAMQVKTCFREINSEEKYGSIGADIKSEFESDKFYQSALAAGTPWREWEAWIRKQVVDYLVNNNLVDPTIAADNEKEVAAAKAGGSTVPTVEPATED